ncbi:MAG: lipocalin-like domain-containing protein [Alphaproteobacteria bacterium]
MALKPEDIIGAWNLVDTFRENPDGTTTPNQGADPMGIIMYSPDGHMCAITRSRSRPFPAMPDATDADKARMFDSYLSYAGRWSLDGNTVTHHVEHALNENFVGQDRKRVIDHQGDRMVLKGEGSDGVSTSTIIWERHK